MAADKFVAVLFLARDLAHREHLRVTGEGSYAKHVALSAFYEGVIELADKFAEQYQGEYEELLDIPLLDNNVDSDILDVLRQHKKWIDTHREEICSREHTALHNVIDEIVGLYQSTIYKLKFLK